MKIRNIELTEEQQKKIMACCAIDVSASFRYVPQAWRQSGIPKDLWPVFVLRGKDGVESAEIEDQMAVMQLVDGRATQRITSGNVRVSTLTGGIESVMNLPLADGRLLCYRYDADKGLAEMWSITEAGKEVDRRVVQRKEIVRYISPSLQVELQDAINERSVMTDEELLGL